MPDQSDELLRSILETLKHQTSANVELSRESTQTFHDFDKRLTRVTDSLADLKEKVKEKLGEHEDEIRQLFDKSTNTNDKVDALSVKLQVKIAGISAVVSGFVAIVIKLFIHGGP